MANYKSELHVWVLVPLPPTPYSKFYSKASLACMAFWGECLWLTPLGGFTPKTTVWPLSRDCLRRKWCTGLYFHLLGTSNCHCSLMASL